MDSRCELYVVQTKGKGLNVFLFVLDSVTF